MDPPPKPMEEALATALTTAVTVQLHLLEATEETQEEEPRSSKTTLVIPTTPAITTTPMITTKLITTMIHITGIRTITSLLRLESKDALVYLFGTSSMSILHITPIALQNTPLASMLIHSNTL